MLNDIYQGLDPIAFSLGPLVVRWYGLAYVLGFVCAAAIIYFVAKRWKLGMSEDNLLTLMVCAIVAVEQHVSDARTQHHADWCD